MGVSFSIEYVNILFRYFVLPSILYENHKLTIILFVCFCFYSSITVIIITLLMTKMVQKHYALAQRRTLTRAYIVRDLDGIFLPPPQTVNVALPCAPPIDEVELRAFGLL